MPQLEPTTQTFGDALTVLCRDQGFVTATGNVAWSEFSRRVPKYHYESLRKAVAGERLPSSELMEAVAKPLGVEPTHFVEYRLLRAQGAFDLKRVNLEKALQHLAHWDARPDAI